MSHIEQAIEAFESLGENFNDVLKWHLALGVVMSTPEFLCLGYYCRDWDISTPLPLKEANCGFVTWFSGSMAGLKAVAGDGLDWIAFKRGFKNARPDQVYDISKFKQLIH
jgi:hypothetical protein